MNAGKIIGITLAAGIISVGAAILGQKYLEPAATGNAQHTSPALQPLPSLVSLPDFSLRMKNRAVAWAMLDGLPGVHVAPPSFDTLSPIP